MTTPSPYCGRLDEHAPHEWTRRLTCRYLCPGTPVVEGGAEVNESGGG